MNDANNASLENNCVFAPAGSYAIIAAGVFNGDGTPIGETYNQLAVDHIETGIYRLTFPYYSPRANGKSPVYIVKATVINPNLVDAYKEYQKGDKYGKGVIVPEAVDQATIQVSQLDDDYIELWITRPEIRINVIKRALDIGTQDGNILQFSPVDLPFMVEISLYGYHKFGEVEGRLDINKATEEELAELPVVDEELAKRIVSHREEVGPINSLNDLINIRGISKRGVNEIRPFIKFTGKSP